jgi:hypothetical protein
MFCESNRRKYLEENAAAVDVKLTPEELAQVENIVPKREWSLARVIRKYPCVMFRDKAFAV